MPKPLLLAAMAKLILDVNAPPPVRPVPAVTVVEVGVAPNALRADAAVFAPVPPLLIGKAVIPVILPPVILTALAFCTAMVPTVVTAPDANPRFNLASD